MEKCSNCDREIGKLEQAFVFKGNIVCRECDLCLGPAREDNNSELRVFEIRKQSLAYAIRISEPLSTLKRLDTLASRYNIAHRGAGGYGLEFAKHLDGYEKVAIPLKEAYFYKFEIIVGRLIVETGEKEQRRKTQEAKIKVWQKTKEELLQGFNEFKYDLQGLKEKVDYFTKQIDAGIENINQGYDSRIMVRYKNAGDL